MSRQPKILLAGFIALLLFGNFQCGDEEPFWPFPFYVHNWEARWVDNSGAAPILASNMAPRTAFGFRLSATMSDEAGTGLTSIPDNTTLLYLEKPIQRIQFFTPDGFDALPAGADISERFRYRFDRRDGQLLQYAAVNVGLDRLNSPLPEWDIDYYADFLMTSPPTQIGRFNCAVLITFDSTATPREDTLLTLPPIILQ